MSAYFPVTLVCLGLYESDRLWHVCAITTAKSEKDKLDCFLRDVVQSTSEAVQKERYKRRWIESN